MQITEFIRFRFAQEVRFHRVIAPTPGSGEAFPQNLHPDLKRILKENKIPSLYSHQVEAYESILKGQDTLLVSQTASGKTLSFTLPILDDFLKSSGSEGGPFSTLLLYPTKALSRDQEGTLGRFLQQLGREGTGTYDGDTPREEREKLNRSGDFVITNPDMLHSGILPNHHRRWRNFLSRLKYVVVDEIHHYRGTFGSHVALVMKRLLRVCELHGSYPTFIGLSATIGNPGEHAQALFGRPFHVVTKDGSPRPSRQFFFINPPLGKNAAGNLFRKGTGSVTVPLIRHASEQGMRTICFCKARQQVERLTRAVLSGRPDLKEKVRPYRGGLLPNERRQLERGLADGTINTIITTNALELGIDIGDLDFCLLSGHPGTFSSFWQQSGRVGRKGREAVVAFVGRESPVDQYLMNHPEFLWEMPVERAWLNSSNPYIFLQHLPCAANEYPLREEEPLFPQLLLEEGKKALVEGGILAGHGGHHHYVGPHYPSRGVNLRGMTDYNIEIYCGTTVIGEIDPIGARGELYKDAIYQHLGERYMSMDLDLEKKLCRVEKVNVDYYTEAVWESRVTMEGEDEVRLVQGAKLALGPVEVINQPKLYKKIKEGSLENIGYGPITLDPFRYRTTGLCLHPQTLWEETVGKVDRRYLSAAFYGLSYLLRKVAPSFCMADFRDVDTDFSLGEASLPLGSEGKVPAWKSALYLYDTHEGGVGYAEKIFERIEDVLGMIQVILDECQCGYGCPSCVPSLPPGMDNEELEHFFEESNAVRVSTQSLLTVLLKAEVVVPVVERVRRPFSFKATEVKEDPELVK